MTSITDGTGTGNKGKVNEFNQFVVLSESVPSEGTQAERGNGFILHGECHTAAASSGAFMSVTNNSSEYDLEVTRIYIDAHTLTPTDLVVTQVFEFGRSKEMM